VKLVNKGLPPSVWECFMQKPFRRLAAKEAPSELRAEPDHRLQFVCRPEGPLPVRVRQAPDGHLEVPARLRLQRLQDAVIGWNEGVDDLADGRKEHNQTDQTHHFISLNTAQLIHPGF